MMNLSPSPDLRDRNLHCNKMSRKFVYILKFEKPYPHRLSLSFTGTGNKKEADETSHFLPSSKWGPLLRPRRGHFATLFIIT